jgi:hypothetical protein
MSTLATLDIDAVAAAFSGKRFPLEDEVRAQVVIHEALRARFGGLVEREASAPGGRIDFRVADIGVEIKLKGAPSAITRQVARYLDSPSLSGLVLVTAKAVPLPPMLKGKPVRVVNLGAAWL